MFKEGFNNEEILAFKGPLTVGLVSFLANHLKSMLNYENTFVKRLFRVFIELTQNVCYYSAEVVEIEKGMKSGVGWLVVKNSNEFFNITTGNLILVKDGIKLRNNCDEINSLNEIQLRELKRKTRGQAMIRDVGAHIGLIQTSLICKSKLNIKITEVDNTYSFFTISVDIKNEN